MRWPRVATILGGAAACAAALPVFADEAPASDDKRWSANASVVSQYVSRGLRQTWGKQGAVPMIMTTAEFDKYLHDDVTKWAAVIKAANIKVD